VVQTKRTEEEYKELLVQVPQLFDANTKLMERVIALEAAARVLGELPDGVSFCWCSKNRRKDRRRHKHEERCEGMYEAIKVERGGDET
jgi:hypothetical protein